MKYCIHLLNSIFLEIHLLMMYNIHATWQHTETSVVSFNCFDLKNSLCHIKT